MSPGLSADQNAPMNQLVNAMVETAISLLTGISFSAYGSVCLPWNFPACAKFNNKAFEPTKRLTE